MKLFFEVCDPSAYLKDTDMIDAGHPSVQTKIEEIRMKAESDKERARLAFQFVRDEIRHSFDIDSDIITISASEAIEEREGICFAKSHLLAALLRGLGIPSGLCYQRVMRKGTPESGYALHGLNAVYLPDLDKWFRLDPRGNKPGVHSEFDTEKDQLAYTIRTELGEEDYPYVFASPPEEVISSMRKAGDCRELFYLRPDSLFTNLPSPSSSSKASTSK